jgi:hypothetical protein
MTTENQALIDAFELPTITVNEGAPAMGLRRLAHDAENPQLVAQFSDGSTLPFEVFTVDDDTRFEVADNPYALSQIQISCAGYFKGQALKAGLDITVNQVDHTYQVEGNWITAAAVTSYSYLERGYHGEAAEIPYA